MEGDSPGYSASMAMLKLATLKAWYSAVRERMHCKLLKLNYGQERDRVKVSTYHQVSQSKS